MDHARSHTQAVLVRMLDEEKKFVEEAVELLNDRRGQTDPKRSTTAFVRGSAIENAEAVLGRKFVPLSAADVAASRKNSKRRATR